MAECGGGSGPVFIGNVLDHTAIRAGPPWLAVIACLMDSSDL